MYQAAICEDEPVIGEWIASELKREFEDRHLSFAFDLFESGADLLQRMDRMSYDVLFMDIEMPGIDGIEVCRRIRQKNENTLVVFISNKDELVFQSFEVRPFRFIRKAEFEKLLPSLADAVEKELKKKAGSLIRIEESAGRDFACFDANRIAYVEAQGRNCRIVEEGKETVLAASFQDVSGLLTSFPFIQPHRSYLVNCRYIFRFLKQEIELTDGTLIPMSRRRRDEVRQAFLDYMSEV